MREIKFRAWKDNKMYDDVLVSSTGWMTKDEQIGAPNWKETPVMQSTGLKDKNGKEIYEEDIVADKNRQGENRTVAWDNEDAGWFPFSQCSDPYIGVECGNEISIKDVEIIGNIYENPELLTKAPTA